MKGKGHRARTLPGRMVRAAGTEAWGVARYAALYPFGLMRPRAFIGELAPERPPVVGVHGYFHNRSAFYFLSSALRRLGFAHVSGINYNPMRRPITSLAEQLAEHVETVREATGAPSVHLVGHSLGGLVARSYIQDHGGEAVVDRCVTVGTPHAGTFAAYCGVGPAARDMRPGSRFLYDLQDGFRPGRVAYLNLYSETDILIVPPASARLPEEAGVVNVSVGDVGHASMLIASQGSALVCDFLCGQVTPFATGRQRRAFARNAGKGRIDAGCGQSALVQTEEIDETVG
jgi:triacylglycerol lipase